jgi:single-strand DNA-binding protein
MPSATSLRRWLGGSRRPDSSSGADPCPADRDVGLEPLRVYGRLECRPDLRRMPSGRAAAHFTIAVEQRPGLSTARTLQHVKRLAVLASGELAESCDQFLRTGHQVCIEGELRTRNWEDAAGNAWNRRELIASSLALASSDRSWRSNGRRPPSRSR